MKDDALVGTLRDELDAALAKVNDTVEELIHLGYRVDVDVRELREISIGWPLPLIRVRVYEEI